MTRKEYKELVNADLFRYYGKDDLCTFIKGYINIPGFKYMFWCRRAAYLKERSQYRPISYIYARLRLRHFSYKFGIDISHETSIGKGFYIGHFSGIVITHWAIIGSNVNISQGVTIGLSSRGKNQGAAIIGSNVYIGPGAKIIGNVKIGNHVAIGANAVVVQDVPDYGVVVGIPAKKISDKGSEGYILYPV